MTAQTRRASAATARATREDRAFRIRHFPGLTPAAMIFFAYLYVPIAILFVLSFNENSTVTVWTGFTLDWYDVVLSNPDILRAAQNSLVIASSAAISATVVAVAAAIAMTHSRFRGQDAINGVIALPLIVPEIVTAVATLLFFASVGIGLGHFTVILAHTVFCIPFAYLPIRARLADMDPALAEAAADLYADPWAAFRRVTLPLLWPGVLSGLVLAFIISLDDFVITFFVAGAGATTLPVYIYGMVRIGITPEVNAVSTLMIAVSVGFVTLSFFLSRQRQ
ncbi:MAG: ABC transporter permease [Kiloniellales bacterium]